MAPHIAERLIGATWHSAMRGVGGWYGISDGEKLFQSMSRYQQISADALRRKASQWIAIDDDIEGWPASAIHRVVECQPELGLSADMTFNDLSKKLEMLVENRRDET